MVQAITTFSHFSTEHSLLCMSPNEGPLKVIRFEKQNKTFFVVESQEIVCFMEAFYINHAEQLVF